MGFFLSSLRARTLLVYPRVGDGDNGRWRLCARQRGPACKRVCRSERRERLASLRSASGLQRSNSASGGTFPGRRISTRMNFGILSHSTRSASSALSGNSCVKIFSAGAGANRTPGGNFLRRARARARARYKRAPLIPYREDFFERSFVINVLARSWRRSDICPLSIQTSARNFKLRPR